MHEQPALPQRPPQLLPEPPARSRRRLACVSLGLACLVAGCASSDPPAQGSWGSSDPSTGEATADSGSSGSGAEAKPNGAGCRAHDECESGVCWQLDDQEGYCSECAVDTDCQAGGCGRPTVLQPTFAADFWATCNSGMLGEDCMSDDACAADLVCAFMYELPSGLPTPFQRVLETCSECVSDGDCAPGELCAPVHDQANATGHRACVEPGSISLGEACPFDGAGDEACASGFCILASSEDGLWPEIEGVCSECRTDADCPRGEACEPPSAMFGLGAGLWLEAGACGS